MQEIWKDVVGYEGLYQVSNLGRVKSLSKFHCTSKNHFSLGYWSKEKILKPIVGVRGYLYVTLYDKNKKQKSKRIHQLVAQAFISNPNNLSFVNHKDENVKNNVYSNLEWCTAKYNCNYGTRTQRIAVKNNKPILQFDLNGNFIKEYESITQANKETHIPISSISACCVGQRKKTNGYIFKFKNDKEILQKYRSNNRREDTIFEQSQKISDLEDNWEIELIDKEMFKED